MCLLFVVLCSCVWLMCVIVYVGVGVVLLRIVLVLCLFGVLFRFVCVGFVVVVCVL